MTRDWKGRSKGFGYVQFKVHWIRVRVRVIVTDAFTVPILVTVTVMVTVAVTVTVMVTVMVTVTVRVAVLVTVEKMLNVLGATGSISSSVIRIRGRIYAWV